MAYAGQAGRIKQDAVLKAALSIHSIEARHAAWIRDINGEDPAPAAFDKSPHEAAGPDGRRRRGSSSRDDAGA